MLVGRDFFLPKHWLAESAKAWVSYIQSMETNEQWRGSWTLYMRHKNEGTYRGGEGTTPVTTACPCIIRPLRVKPPTLVNFKLERKRDDKKEIIWKSLDGVINNEGRTTKRTTNGVSYCCFCCVVVSRLSGQERRSSKHGKHQRFKQQQQHQQQQTKWLTCCRSGDSSPVPARPSGRPPENHGSHAKIRKLWNSNIYLIEKEGERTKKATKTAQKTEIGRRKKWTLWYQVPMNQKVEQRQVLWCSIIGVEYRRRMMWSLLRILLTTFSSHLRC